MLSVYQKIFLTMMGCCFLLSVKGQTVAGENRTEVFILEVLSRYKNPLAYYPLRRDLFLPTEEEISKTEWKRAYPENARTYGPFVFLSAEDTAYHRESFVDAYGNPLRFSFVRKAISLKSDLSYFRKKQKFHLNRYPEMGRFLYFNSTFTVH